MICPRRSFQRFRVASSTRSEASIECAMMCPQSHLPPSSGSELVTLLDLADMCCPSYRRLLSWMLCSALPPTNTTPKNHILLVNLRL
eukprot:5577765-Amphidinium_carterae.1